MIKVSITKSKVSCFGWLIIYLEYCSFHYQGVLNGTGVLNS